MKPTVTITINPLFKFVIVEVQADFPVTVFGQEIDSHLSMIIDNVEIEVGLDVTTPGMSLQAPSPITGVHFDSLGLGMGLIFEPPGYALGVQGSFHVGEGNTVVSLDDDTFALVLDFEDEVPVPMYLSFYVPKLTIGTLLTVLTDLTVDVPIPIELDDLSFTWNADPMEPIALPDGTFAKGGYGFSAYMDIFGLRAYANADISLNGMTIDAAMAPAATGWDLQADRPGDGGLDEVRRAGQPDPEQFRPQDRGRACGDRQGREQGDRPGRGTHGARQHGQFALRPDRRAA